MENVHVFYSTQMVIKNKLIRKKELLPLGVVDVKTDRAAADTVSLVKVSVPNCPLLDDGICFIDLPGMNETDEEMDQKVLDLLKDVSMIIFVMDGGPGLTKTGRKTLAALRDPQVPILFVANKFDLWQPSWEEPSDVSKIEETKKKTLDTLYNKLR